MNRLACDICMSPLVVQSGGQTCWCSCCGVEYSMERLREKVQELKGGAVNNTILGSLSPDFEIRGGILKAYNGNASHIEIPDTVIEIGEKAFENCPGIQSVVVPDGVTIIGRSAFRGCKNLHDITFPETLIKISEDAFAECSSLEQITLPQSIQDIAGAFPYCKSLKSINIPDNLTKTGFGTFYDCTSLSKITMSEHRKAALYREEIELYRNGAWHDRHAWVHMMWMTTNANGNNRFYPEHSSPWYLDYRREVDELRWREDELKENTRRERRAEGRCQHCGGSFKGLFKLVCTACGKPQDY